jgi:GT2 family glycosyltransferase
MTRTTRALLCLTAYNGRDFFTRTLDSAARLDRDGLELDVIVLDDCSPEPGWSQELAALCRERGIDYYRSPRNLGIPRNVNLGLKTALARDYDCAIVSNSDVIYPRNAVTALVQAWRAGGDRVGSVTALSCNASIYSLPNRDPDHFLTDQATVDWVSQTLADTLGPVLVDIPTGISFFMLIPAEAIRLVGLMDPIFGRGYCEEVDWSCRSRALGQRACLAPGGFVYHAGGGSNRAAGLLADGMTTVPANEAVIDQRHPGFRQEVAAFEATGISRRLWDQARQALLAEAGLRLGYSLEVSWLPRPASLVRPHCRVAPQGCDRVQIDYLGFELDWPLAAGEPVLAGLARLFDRGPETVDIFDRGDTADQLAQVPNRRDRYVYPTRAA